ncbi:MAG: hypothetical protein ABW126_10055 [Candidatus Sedimenticola sp. 4PFRAG1]
MIKILIKEIKRSTLLFDICSEHDCECDSIELDAKSKKWIETVIKEKPFKEKAGEQYNWQVIEVSEGGGSTEKRVTIEIHRGKSRVKRSAPVPKPVFLKFWNYLHHQKLPSELPSNVRQT